MRNSTRLQFDCDDFIFRNTEMPFSLMMEILIKTCSEMFVLFNVVEFKCKTRIAILVF